MKQNKVKSIEQAVIATFKERRKELGFSYERIGELTGLHRTSISLIERGKIQPTLVVCLKISEALNLKLEDLIKKSR
jgi:DNA-binding XRE family transcriptional regulator